VERGVTNRNSKKVGAVRTDELHKWLMELFLSNNTKKEKKRVP
jgi:hypothetical protein